MCNSGGVPLWAVIAASNGGLLLAVVLIAVDNAVDVGKARREIERLETQQKERRRR